MRNLNSLLNELNMFCNSWAVDSISIYLNNCDEVMFLIRQSLWAQIGETAWIFKFKIVKSLFFYLITYEGLHLFSSSSLNFNRNLSSSGKVVCEWILFIIFHCNFHLIKPMIILDLSVLRFDYSALSLNKMKYQQNLHH